MAAEVNKMGRGGGERIADEIKKKYGVTDAEYGNTFRFAASMLHHHWEIDHDGDPGNYTRPVECMSCRNLAHRASKTLYAEEDGIMTFNYETVVARVTEAIAGFLKDVATASATVGRS